MRISISRGLKGNRGWSKFTSLLLREFKSQGIEIVGTEDSSDIHLILISGKRKSGAKNIVRVDGVYYDQKRLKLNNSIKKTMQQADGIIYQSKWAHKFATGMLSIDPSPYTCIYNGNSSGRREEIKYKMRGWTERTLGYTPDKIFLACSHWRPNKRLEAIIAAFLRARRERPNIHLFVVGEVQQLRDHPNITFCGNIKNDIEQLYMCADYMVHICHLDACPNSVVEGLSAGVPVLCNNIGGTPEIVGDDGIILPLDKPFDFKPIKNMEQVGSKSVDIDLLSQGMLDMMETDWNISRPDLDIKVIAKQYYEFFKLVL